MRASGVLGSIPGSGWWQLWGLRDLHCASDKGIPVDPALFEVGHPLLAGIEIFLGWLVWLFGWRRWGRKVDGLVVGVPDASAIVVAVIQGTHGLVDSRV